MRLQVLQENLSNALTTTSRFSSNRAQLPVLANILLTSKKNKLLISATNLENSISISIGAKVQKEGEITVPARVITDLVSNLQTGQIELSSEKERLKVSSQNFNSEISGMNSSDFPAIPQTIGKGSFSLPRGDFIDSLSKVLFSVSTDETRPVLTGVLFIFRKEGITLVSTDGFRLSQREIKVKTSGKLEKMILPKNVLGELVRLSSDEEEIRFSYKESESQVIFSLNNSILASRVIEGEFPDFEKIIPDKSMYKIHLDKEELLRAVKLASVFARESANMIKVKIKKDSLQVSAESSQSGSQEAKVDAKVEGIKDSKGFDIAFNYRFIEDFLQTVDSDEILLEFSSENAPGVFTEKKDSNYLHLVMPVRM